VRYRARNNIISYALSISLITISGPTKGAPTDTPPRRRRWRRRRRVITRAGHTHTYYNITYNAPSCIIILFYTRGYATYRVYCVVLVISCARERERVRERAERSEVAGRKDNDDIADDEQLLLLLLYACIFSGRYARTCVGNIDRAGGGKDTERCERTRGGKRFRYPGARRPRNGNPTVVLRADIAQIAFSL